MLQSTESQRVGHDLGTEQQQQCVVGFRMFVFSLSCQVLVPFFYKAFCVQYF